MPHKETRYWLATNLSYQDTMTIALAAGDLIESFQRDPRTCEVRFWPGSTGVHKYLSEHLPPGSEIRGDEVEKSKSEFKRPMIVHRKAKLGMDISD